MPSLVDVPLLGSLGDPIAETNPKDMPAIRAGLKAGFNSGRTRSLEWRLLQLNALERLINENKPALMKAAYDDMKVSALEIEVMQLSLVQSDILTSKSHLKSWMQPEHVTTNMFNAPSLSEIIPEPLGCVVIYSAWNYNYGLSLSPLVGALAAGNCVLLKPGDYARHSTQALMQLIPRYLDNECVRVVDGGPELSDAILDLEWEKIFFTGSTSVGRIVYSKAAKHLTPCVLELGGKSPCVVDHKADVKVAAKRIVWGAFVNAGQTCVRPDYVLVHESIAPAFMSALASTIVDFYSENPKQSPWFSRVVNPRNFSRVEDMLKDCQDKVVCGGVQMHDASECYIPPTVVDFGADKAGFLQSGLMQNEIFGPVLPVCQYRDFNSEVVDFVRSRAKPLAAYLFSADAANVQTFKRDLASGSQCINDVMVHLSNEDLPFGGVGGSGFGSYHGKFSFDAFSHKKAVLHRGTAGDIPIRYPPFSRRSQQILKALLNPKISFAYGAVARHVTPRRTLFVVMIVMAYLYRRQLSTILGH